MRIKLEWDRKTKTTGRDEVLLKECEKSFNKQIGNHAMVLRLTVVSAVVDFNKDGKTSICGK